MDLHVPERPNHTREFFHKLSNQACKDDMLLQSAHQKVPFALKYATLQFPKLLGLYNSNHVAMSTNVHNISDHIIRNSVLDCQLQNKYLER